jgi:hypothetical protein
MIDQRIVAYGLEPWGGDLSADPGRWGSCPMSRLGEASEDVRIIVSLTKATAMRTYRSQSRSKRRGGRARLALFTFAGFE